MSVVFSLDGQITEKNIFGPNLLRLSYFYNLFGKNRKNGKYTHEGWRLFTPNFPNFSNYFGQVHRLVQNIPKGLWANIVSRWGFMRQSKIALAVCNSESLTFSKKPIPAVWERELTGLPYIDLSHHASRACLT